MNGLDVSRLSAGDCIAALRSYPARFRACVLPVDDPDLETTAEQIGPEGVSAVDLVVSTANTWVLLGQALHRTIVEDGPVLDRAVIDGSRRSWELPPGTTVRRALEHLADEAEALATQAGHVAAVDWHREGALVEGGTMSALGLLQEAVRTGADNLRSTEHTLTVLRADEKP